MTISRARPLKMETPDDGNNATDFSPKPLARAELVSAAGLACQDPNAATGDNNTYVDRPTGSARMRFTDENLQVLLAVLANNASDVPSTAYYQVIGGLFPTQEIWWTDANMTKRIKDITYTQSGGSATAIAPTPIVTRYYAADGITIIQTFTDTCSYNGPVLVSKSRVVS